MLRRNRLYAVLILITLSTATLFCHQCNGETKAADAPSNESRSEVLVLQGGGVLTGEITRSGDRYVVKQPQGEINIAAANVVAIGASLSEAYESQRQKTPNTVEAHLALADWCLRYKLLPQAACELMDARGLDAHHPRLALLERRLAAAGKTSHASAPTNDASSNSAAIADDQKASSPALLPPNLPDGVVEHFTRRVQPILVNNCTVSGCHQPGDKQSFQLDRSLLHGYGNRRTTASNLAATLALVDREQPHLSPLLTIPRQAHAGMHDPLITPRQKAAFAHLVEWVRLVTQTQPAVASATEGQDASTGSLETTIETAADEHSHIEAADYEADSSLENANMRSATHRRVQFGAPLQGWRLKDEVDAERFNRASHPEMVAEPSAEVEAVEAGDG